MKTLIKREFVYFYLKSPLVIILNIILIFFILPSSTYPIFASGPEPKGIISILDKLLPGMIILLLGTQCLTMQFYKEKINRNIEVFLGLGFTPIKIWFCKMASIWTVIYLLYLIGILLSLIISRFIIPSENLYRGDLSFYLNLFLFSPLIGLSILGLNGIFYLILDDIRIINFLIILFVILFLFFLPQISKIIPITNILSHFPILSILFTLFLVFLSFTILRLVPTERYLQ